MKTTLLFSAVLACTLLATQVLATTDAAASWYAELNAAQQISHQDAGGRARADTILRTALIAAKDGLVTEPAPAGASLKAAAAQAAYSVLTVLYPQSLPVLDVRLAESLATVAADEPTLTAGRKWGEHVAQVVLAEHGDAVFLNPASFAPKTQPPAEPRRLPDAKAEDGAIPPGRYRFTTLAGAPDTAGHVDGIGAGARFGNLGSIAVDAVGTVYVAEEDLGTIRKITANGEVSTLAGTAGQLGNQDGAGPAARFNRPIGVAVDGAGNVFVADYQNHAVRKIDPAGNVTTIARGSSAANQVGGASAVPGLDHPLHVAVDAAGNVFVSAGRIIKITPDGTAAALTFRIPNHTDASGTRDYSAAGVWQLVTDHVGNLYVILSDAWDYSDVVKLTPTGDTYEGTPLLPPAPLRWATGLGLDDDGNVYVLCNTNRICVFTPGGETQVRYATGYSNWDSVVDITVGRFGKLYVVPSDDSGSALGTIETGLFDPAATGPVILEQPSDRSSYRSGSVNFIVQAVGGAALTYQWYFNSKPINGATYSSLPLDNVQDHDAGFYSVVVTDSGGSVTSSAATLVVQERSQQAPPPPPPPPPSLQPGSGSGSFDLGFSLAVLSLLAAAALRRRPARGTRNDFTIAGLAARAMEKQT